MISTQLINASISTAVTSHGFVFPGSSPHCNQTNPRCSWDAAVTARHQDGWMSQWYPYCCLSGTSVMDSGYHILLTTTPSNFPMKPDAVASRSEAQTVFASARTPGSLVRAPLCTWISVYACALSCDGVILRPESPTDCPYRIMKLKKRCQDPKRIADPLVN
jgi:hypothetical protein